MPKRRVFHTKLCDILDIEYPIILAGMGNACGPRLVAAVSNAGGLGMLGVSLCFPEEIRRWIHETRKLTDKPFGVDILMPESVPGGGSPTELKKQFPKEHVAFIEKLKKQFNVPEAKARDFPLTEEFAKSQFQVVLDEKVPVFAAGLGSPEWVIPEAHAHGVKVISLVGNVKSARRVKERGADILVAQGHEAGGHTGRIGTMALVPQVIDAVNPLPVVAAGGIADGRGVAAALALGATGVWVGTAFLATREAFVDHLAIGYLDRKTVDHYQHRILEATEEDARIFRIFTGKTARALRSKFTEIWDKSGMSTLPMPLQWMLVADFQEGMMKLGDPDFQPLFSGQIAGMITKIKGADELMEELVDGTVNVLKKTIPAEVTIK